MNPWAAIVGRRQSGKLSALREMESALLAAGRGLGGFIQEPLIEAGVELGFDLIQLGHASEKGAQRLPLARESTTPRLCNWGFSDEAFGMARRWVQETPHPVVALELGPLEAAEEGHWDAVQDALEGPTRLVVLCIRPRVLARIGLRLPDPVLGLELPASEAQVATFGADVVRYVRGASPS